jgi:5-methylcytosine-specific restriction endonuclease McrA
MGIDRIDNNKGYFWENCVPACKECNTSKSSCSIELMRKILEWKKYGG